VRASALVVVFYRWIEFFRNLFSDAVSATRVGRL
jgi:hypothetical protein